MYYYGGYQGYGSGQPCCQNYQNYGYGINYGTGYGYAIGLVLFILLIIIIGARGFGSNNGCNRCDNQR